MQQALLAPVNEDDRPRFSGHSAAGIAGFPSACGKKPGEGGLVDRAPPERCNGARAERSATLVSAAHAEFVAALTGHPPRTIPLDADAIDLEDRAHHLGQVFGALSAYMSAVLDDTAYNVPGRLDLPDVEAILANLASDVTGTIQLAAEGMDWRDA